VRLRRRRTTPDGLDPGSETGLPALLGTPPRAPVARGPIEAAAAGIALAPGHRAWRLDLRRPDGTRTPEAEARLLVPLVAARLPAHAVTHLRGHRLLASGRRRPVLGGVAGLDVEVWPDGAALAPILDARTTVVCGPGAAAGIARLLGARVTVPDGATGDVDTDLAALERADAHLIAPLAAAARRHGALLAVTADHGTCPRTGRHDGAPVPLVLGGPDVTAAGPERLTERAVAGAAVVASLWADAPRALEAAA
jgi:2,3-bisphosphoglycerate-independent phosphoglycerate mutase